MSKKWLSVLACVALGACQPIRGTGLSGPSVASVVSYGSPGIYKGFSTQRVTDLGVNTSSAIFRSTHPGASEDGFGVTDWTYVRAIDLNRTDVLGGKLNLPPEVVRFFRNCAPDLDPTKPADAVRSGNVVGTQSVRLVLVRLDWSTEIGPGPNRTEAARISNAKLELFGATKRARTRLSVAIAMSMVSIGRPGKAELLVEYTANAVDPAKVHADCNTSTLRAESIVLNSTGWFPRGDVNNIQVEVVER